MGTKDRTTESLRAEQEERIRTLLSHVKIREHASQEGRARVYESELGQLVYFWRIKFVGPLVEQVKDVFVIDPLTFRGFHKAEYRFPFGVAASRDGLLQPFVEQTTEGSQAHAWKLDT